MTRRMVLAAAGGVLFGAVSLAGHHAASTAYDVDKKITLRGTVTRV